MRREIVRDWKNKWIKINGETDELEVVIQDSNKDNFAPYVYEGCFKDIPKELLDRRVIESWKIIDSSEPERVGAYSLTI